MGGMNLPLKEGHIFSFTAGYSGLIERPAVSLATALDRLNYSFLANFCTWRKKSLETAMIV